jgi:hypothetical protein
MTLLPGGMLVLDNEEGPFRWRVRDWGEPSDCEISLCVRVLPGIDESTMVYVATRHAISLQA